MRHQALVFLTDFADQAVVVPLFVATAMVLLCYRQWSIALAWFLTINTVLGTLLLLKVVCFACGWLIPAFGPNELALQSPSGHVGSSAAVYGSLAVLFPGLYAGMRSRTIALGTGAGVAALIGSTRLLLGAHSIVEVLLGAAVGVTGAVAFGQFAGPRVARSPSRPLMVGSLLVLAAFHGRHLPAEAVIQGGAGGALRRLLVVCQPDPAAVARSIASQ